MTSDQNIYGNIKDYQNPYEDRVTAILQKRAQPIQTTPEQQDYATQAAINYALAGRDRGVSQILDAIVQPQIQQQNRELESVQGLYNVFEQKVKNNDAQSKALLDKMNMFTGGDPQGNALFLQELHNDPEEIDPSNPYQVMTKMAQIAKRTGYKPLDARAKEANIASTYATINKKNADGDRELKSTEMKEIFDQEDIVNSASDSLSIIQQMESLNSMPTYEGPAASQRASVGSLAGSAQANNTLELDNLAKNLAASMLKTTFTGAISNAEREFLQDLQASANKTAAQRSRILNNGKKLIEARAKRAQQKQQRIQSGTYMTQAAELSPARLGAGSDVDVDNMTEEELDALIESMK